MQIRAAADEILNGMLREQFVSAAIREWPRRWRTNQPKEVWQERGLTS